LQQQNYQYTEAEFLAVQQALLEGYEVFTGVENSELKNSKELIRH